MAREAWVAIWSEKNWDFPRFEDMTLTPGARYHYRVKARRKDGIESAPSNIASAQTPVAPVLSNNLLRDRQATASSYQWRKVPARQAVDGTQWTRWQSKITKENVAEIEWLQVDMGSRQTFDKVRLIWQRGSWALKYDIRISDDAAHWQTVASLEKATAQTIEVLRFPAVTALRPDASTAAETRSRKASPRRARLRRKTAAARPCRQGACRRSSAHAS